MSEQKKRSCPCAICSGDKSKSWQERRDEFLRDADRMILKYGFMTQHVVPNENAKPDERFVFSYTVGFVNGNRPEILVAGLSQDSASAVLWDLYWNRGGWKFEDGEVLPDLAEGGFIAAFKEMTPHNIAKNCSMAVMLAENSQKTPRVLQLVLPDQQNRLPWEYGYDMDKQPLLYKEAR